MENKLEYLNSWLTKSYTDYLAMVEIGSTVVGDKWIDGRSDYDILLIFKEEPLQEKVISIRNKLLNFKFDSYYNFVALPKSDYVGPLNHSHDFSHKFRSKILYGMNLLDEVQLPSSDVISKIYKTGLEKTIMHMQNKVINVTHWPDEKSRTIFWKYFKHTFMYLAIKQYYETGNYPKTREDVVKSLNSKELVVTLDTLNNINSVSSEKIVSTVFELLHYLKTNT